MEWLLAPIDGSRPHEVGFFVAWHGRSMFLAWVILIPTGVLLARFFKVWPGQNWPHELDDERWWISHLLLQQLGALVTVLGVILILWETRGSSDKLHHWLPGYFVIAACLVMVLAGWLRGSKGGPTDPAADEDLAGDHFDMTRRRRVFEYLHKFLGYGVLLVAATTVYTGMWAANGPRWMWIAISVWWLCVISLAIVLQRRGMAHDTYQAIWGPNPDLPGNRVKPIGWGIRRK